MNETMLLGPLSARTGETTRQIQRVVDEGLAPRPEKKGQYDVWAVVRGLIRYYKDKSAKVSESRTVDAARKATAEADSAELDAAKKRGEVMLTKDVEVRWADRIIAWRKIIQSKPNWETTALLKELAKYKTDEQ
ncbi:MAG: hypothetical protein QOE26_2744 [Verrucomicrobiota bacterium]|jgi:phage terminase Nu1 subunit (DNA packaging protein)